MVSAWRASMRGVIVLVVLAVLAAAGFLLWQQYTRSPQYAALKTVQALSDRDWQAFAYWVDVHAVVEAAVAAETSRNPAAGLLGGDPALRGGLVAMGEQELRRRVEQGTSGVPANVPLPVLFASGVVRGASLVGQDAYVTAEATYGGRSMSLDLRLRRAGGRWRVVEVRNASELLRRRS